MRHELALAIGKTIARWRKAQGMTQEQLALALDVDPITVSRFERGVTLPSLPTLHRMSGIFGIPLARLFEDAPLENRLRNDAELLAALMGSLSNAEKDFVFEMIKRFCALKK
ncbi:MAG: helix-turn-helix transcriptional regulator [Rhodocyclaceae bacterium]|nr:helix-turn-helix transcriptional regulator [Rhodocyclaceae bacterium]